MIKNKKNTKKIRQVNKRIKLPGRYALLIAAASMASVMMGPSSVQAAGQMSLASFGVPFFFQERQMTPDILGYAFTEADSSVYKDKAALEAFYAARNNQPLWIGPSMDRAEIDKVLAVLDDAWTHGLNPAHYNTAEIRKLLKSPLASQDPWLELRLSDAVMRYGQDMTGMRFKAASLGLDAKDWRQPKAGSEVLGLVAASAAPEASLKSLSPQSALYDALRQELVRLTVEPEVDAVTIDGKTLDQLSDMVRPGKVHKAIPYVREKLTGETGDAKYDTALAEKVKEFQTANGLKADGILGAQTFEILFKSKEDKIGQIVATMEHLRWLPETMPDRYVLVNVPQAQLYAYNEGEQKLTMPVIVGKPIRQTQLFATEITGVRFNPDWTVPPTIKKADYLPMLRQNPYALAKKGIRFSVDTGNGFSSVDPGSINWNSVSSRDLHRIRMVQPPGGENALGKIRVIMPNPYNIYLHDTNHPELFAKSYRAQSSGCVRLSDPEAMAGFLLDANEKWSEEKMKSLLESGRKTDIGLDMKIPVYIVYHSVWLNDEGRLVYGSDIYKQDKKLMSVMAENNAFSLPELEAVKAANASENNGLGVALAKAD